MVVLAIEHFPTLRVEELLVSFASVLTFRNRCLPIPSLTMHSVDVNTENPEKIEMLIVVMYTRTYSANGVNEARNELLLDNGEHPTNQTDIAATCATRGIPSRAYIIWSLSLVPVPILPSHALWTTSLASDFG